MRRGFSPAEMRLAALFLLIAATELSAAPLFVERAKSLNIDHRYTGGWTHFVGGGIAVFDCDGDNLPEVFAAGGAAPSLFLRNRSTPELVRYEVETHAALNLKAVTGAYPIDIDSDGWTDLVILRVGPNAILKGGPDCAFAPFEGLNFDGGDGWTVSFSATWEADQRLPTLAFGNYVDRYDSNGPFEACDDNDLFRPTGGAYLPAEKLAPGFCALSLLFTDWNRVGRADLRVSNDRHYYVRGGAEQMWAMEATPRLYSEADGWRRLPIWGMGIATRDVNRDGAPDVYLTSMGDQKLQYRITGDGPSYEDALFAVGAAAHRPYFGDDGRPSTGWHAEFGDVDNDGRDDLFVAKGNVEQMPSNAMEDPNNLLMQTEDGRFEEWGKVAKIASTARSRGAALTDLNLDGALDLIVVNRNAPLEIHQNISANSGGWLLIDLQQPGKNRNAVGAWIEVRANGVVQAREVTIGGGHASGWLGPHHFGLGRAKKVSMRVIWPDGETSEWRDIEPRSHITLAR